jgi:hypothetical protein
MALEPFATPAQMEARAKGAILASDPFVVEAINAASRRIRNFCRWHIAPVITETVKLPGRPCKPLLLPTLHLVDLLAMSSAGVPLDVSTIDWDATGVVEYTRSAPGRRAVEVTFTHGYEDVPEDIVDLTLMVASRALGSPLGVVREQTMASSITWSQAGFNVAGGTVLLEHEQDSLGIYRRPSTP